MRVALLTALLLHACIGPACAQSAGPPEGASPAASRQPVRGGSFSLASLDRGKIDSGIEGMSASSTVEALEALTRMRKGEFETSAEFAARQAQAMSNPVVGDTGIHDLFPFVMKVENVKRRVSGVAYSYDADKGEAAFYIMPSAQTFNGVGGPGPAFSIFSRPEYDTLDLEEGPGTSGLYSLRNGVGASVRVGDTKHLTYGFATENIPFVTIKRARDYFNPAPAAKVNMDPATAARELPMLKALLVIKLKPPYLINDLFVTEAERHSRYKFISERKFLLGEVATLVFYSGTSGDIFARFPQSAPVPSR